jgi:GNAT superfamily N-acetyltransferase
MVDVSEANAGDARLDEFFHSHRTTRVARRGAVLDVREKPALIASRDDEVVGVLSYDIDGADCEVVHMRASGQWGGVGTALLDRLDEVARTQGCSRLWLVTTNDNIDAIRFYQRRGYRICDVRCGAAEDARRSLLPEIPEIGNYEIPIRDELEFERSVDADG